MSGSSSSDDDEVVDDVETEEVDPCLLDAVLSTIYDCGDETRCRPLSPPTLGRRRPATPLGGGRDAAKQRRRGAPTDASESDRKPAAQTEAQADERRKISKRNVAIGGMTRNEGLRNGRPELPAHLRDLHQAALGEPQSPIHNDGEPARGRQRVGVDTKNGAGGEIEVSGERNGARPGGSRVNTRGKAIEVVVYEDSRKRRRQKETVQAVEEKDTKPSTEVAKVSASDQETGFSIEKARLEVHKFGLTGYSRERQRECERARAIRLGAKPPKPEYINYKELLNQKRQQKEETQKRQLEEVDAGIFNKKKGRRRAESRRGRHDDLGVQGMPGRFRGGALLLNKEDLRRIKASRS